MIWDGQPLKQLRVLAESTEVARNRAERASQIATSLGLTELAESLAELARTYQELLDGVMGMIGEELQRQQNPPAAAAAADSDD